MISSLYKKHSITFFYLMLLLVFSHSFISAQTPDMPFNIYLKQASLKEFTAKENRTTVRVFFYLWRRSCTQTSHNSRSERNPINNYSTNSFH